MHSHGQAAVIEDAKLACIARDKAKSELATIKQQAEKAKLDFEVGQGPGTRGTARLCGGLTGLCVWCRWSGRSWAG